MKIKIIGSTKVGHVMTKEDALDLGGKSAGICYMPDDSDAIFSESKEKTNKRIDITLGSGHHSVYDHPTYNLLFIDVPKIFAMFLNNEHMYTTSERSGRYTKMKPTGGEKILYDKWQAILQEEIRAQYPEMKDKQVEKLAQENARFMISVFCTATFEYTVSFRQLNYLRNWAKDYVLYEESNPFNDQLKPYFEEFINMTKEFEVHEINTEYKQRTFSLMDKREKRNEEFGENYSVNYKASLVHLAQAQRHRTLDYTMKFLDKPEFIVPAIIEDNKELKEEWLHDIESIAEFFPQGMLVSVNERGTYESFIQKCMERICGFAQLEIMRQTKKTLEKYIENVKDKDEFIYNELVKYNSGTRCMFPNFKCTSPCFFGPKNSLDRKI